MLDVVLDYILFNTLSSPSTFFIIFDIRIHLRLKTNEFSDRDTTSFVLEFSNDFFIDKSPCIGPQLLFHRLNCPYQ